MATILWSAWLPQLLVQAAGVSEPLAEMHLREAAIDFFERSRAWIVDHDAIDIEADESTYALSPPAGTRIVRLERVFYDKRRITSASAAALAQTYGDYMQAPGTPCHFLQEQEEDVILVPRPSVDLSEGLTLKVSVTPTRTTTATGIDGRYGNRHFGAILDGALTRVLSMPAKEWTSMDLAAYHRGLFEAAITTARISAQRGLAGARLRTTPHYF